MILAVAALTVAGLLAFVPAIGAGSGAPIAIGAGLAAVGLVVWSLTTGAIPPLLIAVLVLFSELAGAVLFSGAGVPLVAAGAAGFYVLIELSLRSLEVRGRHPGWRSFRMTDGLSVVAVALLVGATTWLVAIVATGFDLQEGIFMQAVGIASAAGVIGVVWLLVTRDESQTE